MLVVQYMGCWIVQYVIMYCIGYVEMCHLCNMLAIWVVHYVILCNTYAICVVQNVSRAICRLFGLCIMSFVQYVGYWDCAIC